MDDEVGVEYAEYEHPEPWWEILLYATAAFVGAIALAKLGHSRIDLPEPNIAGARLAYGMLAIWAALCVGFVVWKRQSNLTMYLGYPMGLPFGLLISMGLEYYDSDVAGLYLTVVGILWLFAMIPFAIGAGLNQEWGREGMIGLVAGVGTAFMVVAGLHLSSLEEQAAAAREAHASPGFEWLAAVVLIGFLARRYAK